MAGENPGTRVEGRVELSGSAKNALGSASDAPIEPAYTTAVASLVSILKGIGNWLSGKSSIAPISATDTFQVQTSATGADFVALPTVAAKEFRINNDALTVIEIRKVATGGSSNELIALGASASFACLANMDEWEIRRADSDNAQVTVNGSYINR
jgi:hypothetical protein